MAKEIERKFLVVDDSYKVLASGSRHIAQAYLSADPDATVRVRIAGDSAFLTVKSRNIGASRGEWEYPVPVEDARQMLALCRSGLIDKTRYFVPGADGLTWEVDEFHGPHDGLVVAEVELPAEDVCPALPAFVGREVTGDARYYNSSLASSAGVPSPDADTDADTGA